MPVARLGDCERWLDNQRRIDVAVEHLLIEQLRCSMHNVRLDSRMLRDERCECVGKQPRSGGRYGAQAKLSSDFVARDPLEIANVIYNVSGTPSDRCSFRLQPTLRRSAEQARFLNFWQISECCEDQQRAFRPYLPLSTFAVASFRRDFANRRGHASSNVAAHSQPLHRFATS